MSENKAIQPDYYRNNDDSFDVIDVANKFNMNFNLGNVLKYITRAGYKNPDTNIQDLEKAQEYLKREIEHLKSEGIWEQK